MPDETLAERMAGNGLRLPEKELVPFAAIVADVDRISGWLRAAGLSHAAEPATVFAAPKPEGA